MAFDRDPTHEDNEQVDCDPSLAFFIEGVNSGGRTPDTRVGHDRKLS
jgi:hypothetical protein